MVQPRLDVGGGAERVVVSLARGMTGRGHEVEVFTDRADAHGADPGVHVVRPGFLGRVLDSKQLREPSIGRRLGVMLTGFDLVVIHNSPALRWIGGAKGLPPVLWYCHEPSRSLHAEVTDPEVLALTKAEAPGNEHLKAEAAKLLRRATKRKAAVHRRRDAAAMARVTRVVANSAYTAGKVTRIFDRPCGVCRPGVAVPDGEPLGREDFVLAVGSVVPLKNVHNVVEAVRRLEGVRLVVTGDPDDALRRLADDRVEFVGPASDADLDRLYRRCALLAYVPVGEPFGLVAIEAMARSTAVVASAYGGPTESVVDRESGSLANPFDVDDVAAKIRFLLGDAPRRREMGEAGRRRYEAHFTLDAFLDRFEAECRATVEG